MPSRLTSTLKFLLPFSYFFATRLKKLKDIVFHLYYEWIIGFLILYYYSGFNLLFSLKGFLLAYLAFIAIYEIGYLANDLYSVRFEKEPRRRLGEFIPSGFQLAVWVVCRLAAFIFISYYLDFLTNTKWLGFYGFLVLFFATHNLSANNNVRGITFISLSVLRFFAPVFMFIPAGQLYFLLPFVMLNYVMYRTYNYWCSKNLIKPTALLTTSEKIVFYLFSVSISLLFGFYYSNFVPFFMASYYAFFWICILVSDRFEKSES